MTAASPPSGAERRGSGGGGGGGGGGKGGGKGGVEGKLGSIPKPDEKVFKERIDAETKVIDEHKAKIAELAARINASMSGKDEYNRRKGEVSATLDDLQRQAEKLENERKEFLEKIQLTQAKGREMQADMQKMRKEIGFSTEEEIDRRIKEIEDTMMTSTINLKEEKRMMAEISALKARKPKLGTFSSMEMNATSFEGSSIVPLKARLDAVHESLQEVRAKKREETLRLREMIAERQSAFGPVRELIDARDTISRVVSEHVIKRREIQDEQTHELKKWQAFQAQLRTARNERFAEEKTKRRLEGERVRLERQLERVDEGVVEDEVVLLQQTVKYVKKVMGAHSLGDAAPTLPASDVPAPPPGAPEETALLPKNKREEEYFFAPKIKAKKKAQANKERKPKTITHDIGTLAYFEQIGVPPPVTEELLEPCLKQLEEKLAVHQKNQDKHKAQADERKQKILAELEALDMKAKKVAAGEEIDEPVGVNEGADEDEA
eukprot:GHVT01066080.1.p1 GENE.GHVT01066080.1~~GHVT01066080.1.p1  ORF type:complete len:493 (+),score=156.85 GHVT01066080.1:992-2470(+)